MDRPTVFVGALPRAEDFLSLGQDAMVGLGFLAEATLGLATTVDGFTLTPTSPASLSAVLSGGSVYEQENLEATAWSALPANSTIIVKQGIALNPQNVTFTPPTATGYAQCFLVEVSYLDADTGSLVLPYYNAANPQVPFSGPANAGSANNTVRQGAVAVQVKAGIAAPSGTQVVPPPDAGWAGLYVVTLTAGATTVTAGNIALYSGAPFVLAKLPQVPGAVQSGQWTFAGTTTNSGNAFTANLSPAPATLPVGMTIRAKMSAAPTGPATFILNGQTFSVVLRGGAPLIGDEWNANDIVAFNVLSSSMLQIAGPGVPATALWHTGTDTSTSAATIIATANPPVPTRIPDLAYLVFPANPCAGATQINVGFGLEPLTRNDTTPLQADDYIAGQPLVVVDDGTQFRVTNMTLSQIPTVINALKIVGSTPYQYATAGSYTLAIAAGVTFSIAECRGSGGGGGGCAGSGSAGEGGGGGGWCDKLATTTAATVLAITVGAAGTPGTAGGGNGGVGGTTSVVVQSGSVTDAHGNTFASGQTLCAATGGGGGTGTGAGNTSPAVQVPLGFGGAAAGGDLNYSGDNGGLGIPLGAGNTPTFLGGFGGLSPFSGGSPQPNIGQGNSSSAAGTGGNGGSSASAPGGPGTTGRVTIYK